uniref:Spike protein/glycoprotein n=1 Tax=Geladintestivirus 6 TaxID=3233138 RepID=A0AAU8MHC2_9CAUD
MADSKVFMFPDGNQSGNSSIDPALLMALNNGGMGGNGNWMWVIFLFFLFPLLRRGGFWDNDNNGSGNGSNCNGFGYLGNMINNNDGRQLLDAAINRNGASIDKLASMFGCGKDAIIGAINGVQQAICGVNGNIADVKYAMSLGNKDMAQQLASCCCNIRESITQGNYQNQLQTVNQTNQLQQAINSVATGQERGFSSVTYETQRQTCDLKSEIKNLGTQITTQFGELATRALQDKLDSEREKNSSLMNQLSNEHQTALIGQQIAAATNPLAAAIAGVTRDVDAIKCKLPDTATVPNPPGVLIPNCVAYNAFGLGAYGLTQNGSIWS